MSRALGEDVIGVSCTEDGFGEQEQSSSPSRAGSLVTARGERNRKEKKVKENLSRTLTPRCTSKRKTLFPDLPTSHCAPTSAANGEEQAGARRAGWFTGDAQNRCSKTSLEPPCTETREHRSSRHPENRSNRSEKDQKRARTPALGPLCRRGGRRQVGQRLVKIKSEL